MTTDFHGAARFVAAPDHWDRGGVPIKAISIHMAEGGGTVSWLTRDDGNSSHYVVEYDGDVVQMVRESRAAGSMNPTLTRTTDDAQFTYLGSPVRYGRTALDRALGRYATNPNAAVIAIEIEGFAATGPNPRQRQALVRLISDIRRRRGALPCIGHRDQQAYKRCPGRLIPWADYGGHAVATTETVLGGEPNVTTRVIQGSLVPEVPQRVTLKPGAWLYVYSDHRANDGNIQMDPPRPLFLTRFIDADTYAVGYEPTGGDEGTRSREYFVKVTDIAKTEPYQGDSSAQLAAVRLELGRTEAQLTLAKKELAEKEALGLQIELLAAKVKA